MFFRTPKFFQTFEIRRVASRDAKSPMPRGGPKTDIPYLRGTRKLFFASRDEIPVKKVFFASRDATPRGTSVPVPKVYCH